MAVKMLNIKPQQIHRPQESVFEDQDIEEIEREIDLVKTLQHRHVVKYLGRGKTLTTSILIANFIERLGDVICVFMEYLPLGSIGRCRALCN